MIVSGWITHFHAITKMVESRYTKPNSIRIPRIKQKLGEMQYNWSLRSKAQQNRKFMDHTKKVGELRGNSNGVTWKR